MNLYAIDVQIAGTAYIKAKSKVEAKRKLAIMQDAPLEIHAEGASGWVSSAMFRDPALPEVSLSPAMTIHGKFPGAGVELRETNLPEDESVDWAARGDGDDVGDQR
jgi:hypothetical protein